MPQVPLENTSAQAENQHHNYIGNDIPWYVRLLWVGFWVWAIWYVIRYAIPMAKTFYE